MIPRTRALPLVLMAVAACAEGALTPDADQVTTPDGGQTLPPVPDGPAVDATDAGRDGGGEYTYGEWSEFTNCSVTSGAGTKTRTRECKRRDGLPVNCALCGDACTETAPCTASGCAGPREECCPLMPYNVCGPDMTWCTDTLGEKKAACLAAGCLWTGASACTIGGSPSNATLPGGMGTCQ